MALVFDDFDVPPVLDFEYLPVGSDDPGLVYSRDKDGKNIVDSIREATYVNGEPIHDLLPTD